MLHRILDKLAPFKIVTLYLVVVGIITAFWLISVIPARPAFVVDFGADVFRYYLPNTYFSLKTVLSGHLPLWNPFEFAGMPMMATLEYGPLYPPNVLFFLLPLLPAHLVTMYLHVLLFGCSMVLFLRRGLHLNMFPALVGALIAVFSGWTVVRMLTAPDTFRSAAFIPLLLYLTNRLVRRPSSGASAAFALVYALQLLAGEIEVFVRTGFLAVGYAVVCLDRLRVENNSPFAVEIRRLVWFAGACTGALGLCAVQWLPIYEASAQSMRTMEGLTFTQAFAGGKPDPLTLLVSLIRYTPEDLIYYIGILPLGLALLSLRSPRGETLFFLLTGSVVFGLLLGEHSLVSKVYYDFVPTGRMFRAPIRFMPFLVFSTSVLAAQGVQNLENWLSSGCTNFASRLKICLVFLAAAGGVDLLLRQNASLDLEVFVILASVAGAMVLVVPHKALEKKIGRNMGGIALLGGMLLPPFAFYAVADYNLPRDVDLSGIPAPITDFVGQTLRPAERVYVDAAVENGRRIPKYGTINRIPCINGFSPFMTRSFWELVAPYQSSRIKARQACPVFAGLPAQVGLWGGLALENGAIECLNILGVRYVILGKGNEFLYCSSQELSLPDSLLEVFEAGDCHVYENRSAWDRAFILETEASIGDLAGLLNAYSAHHVSAEVYHYEPHEVTIRLGQKRKGLLVLTDQYYPGWRVTVDGEERRIEKVAGVFRGVHVTERDNIVVFRYFPRVWLLGLCISLATFLSYLAWILLSKQVKIIS